jgi:biopolymer transport protein ExbD
VHAAVDRTTEDRSMARKRGEDEQETNLLPVMNIMLLIIPALLLAMEIARMGAIDVRPPHISDAGTTEVTPPPKRLELKVFIATDGYELRPSENADAVHRIALADASLPAADPKRWDLAALESEAARLKALGAYDPVVRINAEGDVPMASLVATMDALRGSECRLGRLGPDETVPDSCFFYSVVIEPGAKSG